MWGSPTGDRGRKRTLWNRIEPPAVAFFYTDGTFKIAARIWAKEPADANDTNGNRDLAQAVWGDAHYEHVVYLDEIEEIDVPSDDLKAALGYESRYLLGREFLLPDASRQGAVLEAFGSPEAFLDALIGRVGTPPAGVTSGQALPATLGGPYRPENEKQKAARGDLHRIDPDAADRGTQGHARTQNRLAKDLKDHGITPRSWFGPEPFYDLAWEQNGHIYVAEVKSLTRRNEERQLRLALGQVLRYAQQLAYKGKPVIKVIATERKPSDHAWMILCAELGVRLIWPDTLDSLT